MNRKAGGILAAFVAVAAPLAAVLVMHQPGRTSDPSCSVGYTTTTFGLRIAVALEQAGSVEVRVAGRVVTQQDQPAGPSTITAQTGATGPVTVTEWTRDGQLVECSVTAG